MCPIRYRRAPTFDFYYGTAHLFKTSAPGICQSLLFWPQSPSPFRPEHAHCCIVLRDRTRRPVIIILSPREGSSRLWAERNIEEIAPIRNHCTCIRRKVDRSWRRLGAEGKRQLCYDESFLKGLCNFHLLCQPECKFPVSSTSNIICRPEKGKARAVAQPRVHLPTTPPFGSTRDSASPCCVEVPSTESSECSTPPAYCAHPEASLSLLQGADCFASKARCAEVLVSSFSFKTGPPCSCNVVTDVRFLPDPKALEEHYPYITGRHHLVENFLRSHHDFEPFFESLCASTQRVMGDLARRGCDRINLAFGCTAGKHRSVFVAEALADWLRKNHEDVNVRVQHKDMPLDDDCMDVFGSQDDLYNSTTVDADSLGSMLADLHSGGGQQETAHTPMENNIHMITPEMPMLHCTYFPDQNRFEISERSNSLPCAGMVNNMLGNGLSNLKSLRLRRATSSGREDLFSSSANKARKMAMDFTDQVHSI